MGTPLWYLGLTKSKWLERSVLIYAFFEVPWDLPEF